MTQLKNNLYSYYFLTKWVTLQTHTRLKIWGLHTKFLKVIIIRGIGYRAFFIKSSINIDSSQLNVKLNLQHNNNIKDLYYSNLLEYPYSKYLIIRAGHTKDFYQGISYQISIKTLKKDRKLVIYSSNLSLLNYIAAIIRKYRKPNTYTGRGIRFKQTYLLRKAGKKDKQKGKAF